MKRPCPICDHTAVTLYYTQRFSELSEGSVMKSYDVVTCDNCGFGFSDNIPSQDAFDTYYKEMSKYENAHRGGEMPEYTVAGYRTNAERVKQFLPDKNARIIDVGCATGRQLSVIKESGYPNVFGLDPSPACVRIAQELYGITIFPLAISEVKNTQQPFDLVMLGSVMEHVQALRPALAQMRDILADNGLIYIEVPDTSRFVNFTSAPFQQFSMEHINFFTPSSLRNLLEKCGFTHVSSWQDDRHLGLMTDPALCVLFKKSDATPGPLAKDTETASALRAYIDRSNEIERSITGKIDEVATSGVPILIWGTGTHTLHLLAGSNLANAKIEAFVDSNVRYQGKLLHGKPIIAPEALVGRTEPILISSQVYQLEIERQIRDDLHLNNELILLYPR